LINASGIVGGMVNTVSFRIISSDPLNFADKLNDEDRKLFERAIFVGKLRQDLNPPPQAKRLPSNSPLLDQVGQFQ
jgi:hypothetical protein